MAKKQTTYKCAYPHCKHDGYVNKEEAVKVGTRYWHQDCLAEKNTMREIERVWIARVDENPIISDLRGQINTLVCKQGNDTEYLLFALNYCLDHGWNLKYPAGLRYVAKNDNARNAWNKIRDRETMQEMKKKMDLELDSKSNDDWNLPIISKSKKTNNTKISNILGV
mgnify:CR=1 FL=1